MISDPFRFSSFQASGSRAQSCSIQEVVNKSQIRKYIPKFFGPPQTDGLKRVPAIKEFGPWPRFEEGCSHKPGATLTYMIAESYVVSLYDVKYIA